ncbi:DUF2232 domain-containing protein [Helcococcus kunzii]|uniref:DUF2232 domain-containing protein n=1 Tax=Helcococcus kunzii TaxID=40091 RepID=UPI0038A0B29C
MDKNRKITYFLDIVMTSAISLLILYTAQTIGFTMLFLLVPSIVIFLKYGPKEFIATLILTGVGLVLFVDYLSIALIIAIMLVLTLFIANMIKKNENIYKIIFTSSMLFVLLISLYIILVTYIYNIDLAVLIKDSTKQIIDSFEKFISEDIRIDAVNNEMYMKRVRDLINYSISIIPSLMLVSGLVFSTTNTIASVNLLNRTEENSFIEINKKGINLKDTIKKSVLLMAVVYFVIMILNINNSEVIKNNLSFLVLFLLFINGVNAAYNLLKNKIGKITFIAIMLLFVVFLQGYTFVAVFGMLDLFFNISKQFPIRKRK